MAKIEKVRESKLYKKYKPNRAELKSGLMWERVKFLRENLVRASNRTDPQPISVDLSYMYEIGEKQNWKCALSGLPLEFVRGGATWGRKNCNPSSCSIDRINSDKGYVKGNIQLIIWAVNCLKRDVPNSEFVYYCKQVAKSN